MTDHTVASGPNRKMRQFHQTAAQEKISAKEGILVAKCIEQVPAAYYNGLSVNLRKNFDSRQTKF